MSGGVRVIPSGVVYSTHHVGVTDPRGVGVDRPTAHICWSKKPTLPMVLGFMTMLFTHLVPACLLWRIVMSAWLCPTAGENTHTHQQN